MKGEITMRKFALTKPKEEELLTPFQEEFLQYLLDLEMKNRKSGVKKIKLINTTDGYEPSDSYIKWDFGVGFFKDEYLNRNTLKFEKSLEEHPVNTNTLVERLQKDLGEDFKVTRMSTGIHNLNEIIVSWK